MSQNYSRSLLRVSVAQICQNLGWNSAQSSSLEVLTDVLERYLLQLGGTCHRYSEQFGRTEPNLDDLGLAFRHMGINLGELEDYVRHVDPVPFAHDVVAFPNPKSSSLAFSSPRSREILHHHEEHGDEHLPYMFPNMKDEVLDEKPRSPALGTEIPLKNELMPGDSAAEGANVGEKRPAPVSTPEMIQSKRQRLGNSSLPEEAGHSQYEMTCVFMGANGVLTTRQGCQGRLPDSRMPPPNPRSLSENNKENTGKSTDSGSGTKLSISVGGIGTDGLNSSKSSRKSGKKMSHKKGLAHLTHDQAARAALEMTSKEIGKKSASSKAAAKFLKKLKLSKKSSKVFKKSKDSKTRDKDSIAHEQLKDLSENINKASKKQRKEKKPIVMDSDEELRNLASPSSSKEPSPERSIIIENEGGRIKKEQMEAINDSINAVLRDGTGENGKVRKKKKKGKDEPEEDGKKETDLKGKDKKKLKVGKGKQGRKPKEKKVETPPAIDIKPFVSDKYSSAELQVYEFNDSPPDANAAVSARRPSEPDSVTPATSAQPPVSLAQPAVSSVAPVQVKQENAHHGTKHSSSASGSTHSSSHKAPKVREIEDDLFAPEIKIESRSESHENRGSGLLIKPFKLDLGKDKEKHKGKEDKKDKAGEDKHRVKEEKDKHKEKKEKHKDRDDLDRGREEKDKHRDKEHRREKKDKKKDKEKKKKHKEKDREREKDKKREEKVKQEAQESRESSPALGMGVKLKIKIGGSSGPSSSVMVTGESNSPRSPPSKRESMSPPRSIPKLYISTKGSSTEEKPKKSGKQNNNKYKSSPLTGSIKSRSTSPVSRVSPSPPPRKTPTPPPPRKTPTPPPPRKTPTPPPSSRKTLPPPSPSRLTPSPVPVHHTATPPPSKSSSKGSVKGQQRRGRSPVKDKRGHSSRKEKKKESKRVSSPSSSPSVSKSPSLKQRQTPPRLKRMSSSSPESSPPRLPAQSPTPSPKPTAQSVRSPSPRGHTTTPPPSLSRRKPTPPPALSPATSRRRRRSPSPSPSKPPTPGSTSPAPSPEWNVPLSPAHSHHSPTPPPRTPTASPSRNIPSPSHSSTAHSPSPPPPQSPRPSSRLVNSPETKVSPASSSKSSSSTAKARTVEAETVCVFYDDKGQKVWICPGCKKPDDGSDMIGCDSCDNWYHWPCVWITQAPPEEQQWFCPRCVNKNKSSSRGRGRPRGRGRGRGRKKIT